MATQKMAIANIERIDIITEESTPRVFSFDTASESSAEAQISAGSEHELRIKNQILAQNITEDIVKGFNISFTDTTFSPEVFALVDGGQSTVDAGNHFKKYSAPTAGEMVARVKCRLAVYASEKDYDGNTLSYTAFIFPHASGTPSSVRLKDGEFFAPSYTMKSRPSKGQSPMTVLSLPSLPVIVQSNNDMPSQPEAGKTVVLCAGAVSQLDGIAGPGHFALFAQETAGETSQVGGAITVGYYRID
ncbi:MAG: hypothetical protein IJM51_01610 [Clostridia bacterium]|nr:hypothetical protein [Clostridia bacterium]